MCHVRAEPTCAQNNRRHSFNLVFSDPWTRWCSTAQLSYHLMQVTELVFYKRKPGEICKQNTTGMDGDLSPGLLFPNEISKVYLTEGSDQKAPCPANTCREHCYLVGIAYPAFGDVRVGLAQKVSQVPVADSNLSPIQEICYPIADSVALGFCADILPFI